MIIIAVAVVGGLAYVATSSDSGNSDTATPPDVGQAVTSAASADSGDTPIEETVEYIRSNEPCPAGLREFESVPVANFGISLTHTIDMPNLTVMTFIDEARGFVGERTGQIWSFGPDGRSGAPVVDLSNDTSAQDDQGLVGMTLSPDAAWLYTNRTNGDGDSIVLAIPHDDGVLRSDDAVEILVVDQPSRQHNGGSLEFGPDGHLYVSLGDGGGLGDPRGHGQDVTTMLGGILRIDVDPTRTPPALGAPGNPYGADGGSEFLWAIGVRNPFRLSFDRVQGDLWIADVGQQCMEEVSVLAMNEGGANLGWNVYEGTRRFVGDPLRDHHEPVYEYRHGRGLCAIVGGYVYRGPSFPELLGRYLFSDLCSGTLFALNPGATPEVIELPLATTRPVGFGQDPTGELYVIDIESGVHRLDISAAG